MFLSTWRICSLISSSWRAISTTPIFCILRVSIAALVRPFAAFAMDVAKTSKSGNCCAIWNDELGHPSSRTDTYGPLWCAMDVLICFSPVSFILKMDTRLEAQARGWRRRDEVKASEGTELCSRVVKCRSGGEIYVIFYVDDTCKYSPRAARYPSLQQTLKVSRENFQALGSLHSKRNSLTASVRGTLRYKAASADTKRSARLRSWSEASPIRLLKSVLSRSVSSAAWGCQL